MVENIAYCLINVMSAVIAVEYMDHGLKKRFYGIRRRQLFVAGCLVYFLMVTGLNHCIAFEGLLGLCYAVVLIVYGLVALKGSPRVILLLGMAWVLVIILNAYMIYAVMGIMTGMGVEELLNGEGDIRVYSSLASLVLKFSMGRMVLALYRKKDNIGQAEDGIIAGTFLLMFVIVLGMFRQADSNLSQNGRYYLSLCLFFGFVGLILMLGWVYHQLGRYYREEQIRDFYRISREVNHLRHDMNGKLDVLYRLAEKGNYEELSCCIMRMGAELGRCPELPADTGNEGVNAMLMKMVPKSREKDIAFRYVILAYLKDIDNMDMGNLLYNLLSNAVEAAEKKEGEKEIELIIRRERQEIELRLENSTADLVLDENPRLQSRKKELAHHGFGMASIYDIIEKYKGEYICWEEPERFIQKIKLIITQHID